MALPVKKKIEKQFLKNNNLKIKFQTFLAYNTPWPPMSAHKKIQPNRSSRLAGYTQHIYIRMSCFII